jgi:hypothetical protein
LVVRLLLDGVGWGIRGIQKGVYLGRREVATEVGREERVLGLDMVVVVVGGCSKGLEVGVY